MVNMIRICPQKDKRFNGTVRLPTIPRPKMKICVLGDAKHCEEAKGALLSSLASAGNGKMNNGYLDGAQHWEWTTWMWRG